MRSFLVFLCLAAPAYADDRLSGEKFAAYVNDRTIAFRSDFTDLYGIERYFPDRRVIWAGDDQVCYHGYWYADKGNICFVYEDDPTPHCWAMTLENDLLKSAIVDAGSNTVIYEIPKGAPPLICDNVGS